MASKAVLNRRDSIRVADALRADWERIKEHRVAPEKVAKQLSEALNLKVTKVNVLAICRDLGLDWPKYRGLGTASGRRDRVRMVCRHIISLCEQLGLQVPQELTNEVRGLSLDQRPSQQDQN